MICWLSDDVARESSCSMADRALLEHGQHQIALTEQVEELVAPLARARRSGSPPWETMVARAVLSLPITREMSARPLKAAGRLADRGAVRSWLPTLSACSSWGML